MLKTLRFCDIIILYRTACLKIYGKQRKFTAKIIRFYVVIALSRNSAGRFSFDNNQPFTIEGGAYELRIVAEQTEDPLRGRDRG